MLLMSQKSEEQKLFHQSQVHGDADHLSGGDISADEIKSRSVVGRFGCWSGGCSDGPCAPSTAPAAHTQLILRLSAAAAETNKRGISTKGCAAVFSTFSNESSLL
jgi:hypothetical protein